jgi:hypothetical protein
MIGGPIGTAIGAPPIIGRTTAELRTALADHKSQIAIDDPWLAWKAKIILKLGPHAIWGRRRSYCSVGRP